MRFDGRRREELRLLKIELSPIRYAEGSALVKMGNTEVLCAVSVEERVPRWLQGRGRGWLTAEYALLPRATHTRTDRSHIRGGRAQEIRRLIGRSLRQAVRLDLLDGYTLIVDCDVLQADGGTRTASINGGYVAVALAVRGLVKRGLVRSAALMPPVAALSVGTVDGEPLVDLAYEEDAQAEMDLNVVMNAAGQFIEVQGTAEGAPVSRGQLDRLLDLAASGIETVVTAQREVLKCAGFEV
ncbi:MAG: ribonuclease PH [Anaerolineae bacterium]|nr:ribonuclease PH [Anaerolineae bacterium]